jgi:excisionase family DNA binding protein
MTERRRAAATSPPASAAKECFLTIAEVAEILRLHPRTVREYVRRGELQGRLIGGRWRFRRKDVDAFFDAAPSRWEFDGSSGHGQ